MKDRNPEGKQYNLRDYVRWHDTMTSAYTFELRRVIRAEDSNVAAETLRRVIEEHCRREELEHLLGDEELMDIMIDRALSEPIISVQQLIDDGVFSTQEFEEEDEDHEVFEEYWKDY